MNSKYKLGDVVYIEDIKISRAEYKIFFHTTNLLKCGKICEIVRTLKLNEKGIEKESVNYKIEFIDEITDGYDKDVLYSEDDLNEPNTKEIYKVGMIVNIKDDERDWLIIKRHYNTFMDTADLKLVRFTSSFCSDHHYCFTDYIVYDLPVKCIKNIVLYDEKTNELVDSFFRILKEED